MHACTLGQQAVRHPLVQAHAPCGCLALACVTTSGRPVLVNCDTRRLISSSGSMPCGGGGVGVGVGVGSEDR